METWTGTPSIGAEPGVDVADLGQAVERHAVQGAKIIAPVAVVEVHQPGARGGGAVGHEGAGQPVEKEGVGGAKPQAPRGVGLCDSRDVAQGPAEFRGGEIGVERQAAIM